MQHSNRALVLNNAHKQTRKDKQASENHNDAGDVEQLLAEDI